MWIVLIFLILGGIYLPFRAIEIWKTKNALASDLFPFFGLFGAAFLSRITVNGFVARIASVIYILGDIWLWVVVAQMIIQQIAGLE